MNQRIRELSEQAHRSTTNELAHLQRVHNRTYDLNESAVIYNEKFAELIVRECSRVAKLEVGTNRVCDAIEKHFGVEE
jgi:hypothetical protein